MRSSVLSVIQELKGACRRSLYEGNDLGLGGVRVPEEQESAPKRRRRHETDGWRSWETILSDAVSLIPQMTEHEHGQVSRLASILLLGFFLPRSTGDEFFLLQNMSSRTRLHHQAPGSSTTEQPPSSESSIGEYILSIPLDERLASIPHEYCSDSFGEINSIVDERFDAVLHSFLEKAIAPFVSSKPAHTREVDLMHVLAMAIHPHPSEQPIRGTAGRLKNSSVWAKTRWLMSSMVPHNFHLNYRHRALLARLVAEHVVLPAVDKGHSAATVALDAPLFEGALPHLRASLYAFGMASMTPYDSHWAQCGMVSIAVQTRQTGAVREEWGRLLNRLMEDRANYKGCHTKPKACSTLSFMTETETSFCPHRARGRLLKVFVSRLGNARHFADVDFLKLVLGSLSDAIEFKVDSWAKEEEGQSSTSEPPCILASLLVAAQPLFCFLLPSPTKKAEEEDSEDDQQRDTLVSCSIQLLHHWDHAIVTEASKLLEKAFSYGTESIVDDYSGALFSSIKLAIDNALKTATDDTDLAVTGIVALVSKKSRRVANAVMKLLTSLDHSEPAKAHLIDRLIASVACACPSAADPYIARVHELLDQTSTSERSKQQLLAALLGHRRSYFFNNPSDGITTHVEKAIASGQTGWDLYLIGRQALVSGNYAAAGTVYEELSLLATSEHSYLWLSALQRIASAEAHLLEGGAMGIPSSSIELRSAASTILSLPSLLGRKSDEFDFQLQFLSLRLDFLDVVCLIRQLGSEMRLTNVGPKRFTRPSLHLKSAVKLLNVLGTKYLSLYRQHGLFICQQSRTALRTMQALCRFVSSATQSTFIDELPDFGVETVQQNAILALTLPQGDVSQPLTVLMKRLNSQVLQYMSGSVAPKLRAAALLQVIDGILKVPTPFPRSFLRPRPVHCAEYRLHCDSGLSDDHGEVDDDIGEEIVLPVGSTVTFVASGTIPASLVKTTGLPFYTILLWHTVSFQEIHENANNDAEHEQPDEVPKPVVTNPKSASTSSSIGIPSAAKRDNVPPANVISSLSPSGKFFVKVECSRPFTESGNYKIETRLGCRDIRGGEWDLPVDDRSHPTFAIRISQ